MRKYRIRLSKLTKTITLMVGFIVVLACVLLFVTPQKPMPTILFTISIFVISGILALTHVPRYLLVTANELIIQKGIGKIIIPFNQIQSIGKFKFDYQNIKVVGSGGFMGMWGLFSNPDVGHYRSYIGNPNESFLILRKDKEKYAVSCEDYEEVIDYIKDKINQ